MDDLKDLYGILALSAAKKTTEDNEDFFDLDDFCNRMDLALRTKNNKTYTKRDNPYKLKCYF